MAIAPPSLSLPAGGAVRGLGESSQPSAFSGAATLSVPIFTTPARGFAPALALAYSSAAGNGPYGLGFSVDVPRISRQTRLHIPRYDDSDTFVYSAAGDLVPGLRYGGGAWVPDQRTVTEDGAEWTVRAYQPRDAPGPDRIERWTRDDDGDAYWRVVGPDGTTTVFGRGEPARIADPDDLSRVFQWLPEESVDTRGNRIVYRWKPEDGAGVPDTLSQAGRSWRGQRYLHAIAYGNYLPEVGGPEAFAFEAVFDYGEYEMAGLDQPGADLYRPVRSWPVRLDPFSSYRGGFELRTLRLCRGVLMFHRFPQLGPQPSLVRGTRLAYEETPTFSSLAEVRQVGYRRRDDGSYSEQALPPLTFAWSRFDPPRAPRFENLMVPRGAQLSGYLAPGGFLPVDLDGEGLPGVLYSDGATTLYYAPLGDGVYAAPEAPADFPTVGVLPWDGAALRDVDGNGRLELVVETEALQGYFAHEPGGGWKPFAPFTAYPAFLDRGAVQEADLEGSGRADLLTFSGRTLSWYPSLGTAGYGAPRLRTLPAGFPAQPAAGELEVVAFADLFGDGLQHRVRVRDGQVQVWPNLGYGRFGAPVSLGNAPHFAAGVSASRIYFADVDGSGLADLVFAYHDRVEVFRNLSGNAFALALTVRLPGDFDDLAQLTFADVRGQGATALVFTRAEPEVRHWFYEFGGMPAAANGEAPRPCPRAYLLTEVDNHLGATMQVTYASSTRLYLEDKRAGRPWPTRLPFPVQVVEKTVTTDAVSGARYAQRFRYHDGYWDPVEREFNGFGYVESWSAETYGHFAVSAAAPGSPVQRLDPELFVPPAYTRAWYCTGAYEDAGPIAAAYRAEYWRDPLAYRMPAAHFDAPVPGADAATQRQAHRALRGRQLRREVYGEDGTPQAANPYTVAESCWQVQLVQPGQDGRPAVFSVRARESIAYDYERDPADPRVRHDFVLEDARFAPGGGNEFRVRTCGVDYARRPSAHPDVYVYPEQAQLKATAAEQRLTRVTQPYRVVGVPFEERAWELAGLSPGGMYFSFDEIAAQVQAALEYPVPYGEPLTPGPPQARTCSWEQTRFWDETQAGALPLGVVSPQALPHHVQRAAFDDAWVREVYGGRVDAALLAEQGGYARADDGVWWNRGLVQHFYADPARFYQPFAAANDFAADDPAAADGLRVRTTAEYDAPWYLAVVEVRQEVDAGASLATRAEIDYHVVQPWQLTNANGVVSQVLYDPLGRPLATSIFQRAADGQPRAGDGDLRDYVVRPAVTVQSVLDDKPFYLQDATTFIYYDDRAYAWPAEEDGPQPAAWVQLARQVHVSDLPPGSASPIQAMIDYADGLGRAVEAKQEAAPGPAVLHAGGGLARDAEGRAVVGEAARRWIVTGRTVYNNQGQPAEEYLPYYSDTARWEPQAEVDAEGLVPPPTRLRYDALLRPVRVETPQGCYAKTDYASWQVTAYDENDTIRDSHYYLTHTASPDTSPEERDALEKAARCFNTPAVTVLDGAGAAIRQVENNLGDVPPDAFAAMVAGTEVTSQALWAELVARGYLQASDTPPVGTWLTGKFQPYTAGFTLELGPAFQPFAPAVTEYLRQGVLTTALLPDVQGRTRETADPRLFYAAVTEGAAYRNFRYAYAMDVDAPAWTESADAGPRWALANMFGSVVAEWDGLGQCLTYAFDRLQRPLTTWVQPAEGAAWESEVFTWGEGQPDAAVNNLRGRLWRVQDQAGVAVYPRYSLEGLTAHATRQLRADPRGDADWAGEVPLDPKLYQTRWRYDVQGRVTEERVDDGTTILTDYHLSGRLAAVRVRDAEGAVEPIVAEVAYAAAGQRLRVELGNGVAQEFTWQDTTRRLVELAATLPAADGGKPAALQDVAYTWDPVGNVTLARDRTAGDVFCYGQAETVGDYRYDLLYRLVSATGREHPGIQADTGLTGFKQSLFAPLCPADPAEQVQLGTYAEEYTYDGSGNLLGTVHTAGSGSYARGSPVQAGSNRLADTPYDARGNPLELPLLNPVVLAWDYRGRLAATSPIERPGATEQDWFDYDWAGDRVRRVVERAGEDGTAETEERIYLGSYQVIRTTREAEGGAAVKERSMLRVLDGAGCAASMETPAAADEAAPGPRRVRWQLGDLLGSVSVEVDGAAVPATYETYLPYGGTSAIAGTDPVEVEPKVYRYSAKECDDSTGLYYYGARYYATWLGRWLNADPAGPDGGLNLFQFVGGNPVGSVDPDGQVGFKVANLTNDEVYAALLDLRTAVRASADPNFNLGIATTYGKPTTAYHPVTITKFMDWHSAIAALGGQNWPNVTIQGPQSTGRAYATWNKSNYFVKGGGKYKEITPSSDVVHNARNKMLGKMPIAATEPKAKSDYFATIASLSEGQRDTIGSISAVMGVHNVHKLFKAGKDHEAKQLFNTYFKGKKPTLSFAKESGGQKFLTDVRDTGTANIDPDFQTGLIKVTKQYLNTVKLDKGGALLSSQTYQSQQELATKVKEVLYRKFGVQPQQQLGQVQNQNPQVQNPLNLNQNNQHLQVQNQPVVVPQPQNPQVQIPQVQIPQVLNPAQNLYPPVLNRRIQNPQAPLVINNNAQVRPVQAQYAKYPKKPWSSRRKGGP
ncbi:MAG TPA: SpvB/TcaC N-terminal domain-containing protein [Longimicrobium sp.]